MNHSINTFNRWRKGLVIIIVGIFLSTVIFHFFSNQVIESALVLRVPLLAGVVLFSLPFLAFYALPSLLENVFVLENPLRLTVVIIQAAVTGLGIVFVWSVITLNTDCRFLAESCSKTPDSLHSQAIVPYLWGVFLAMPVAFASWKMADIQNKTHKLLGVVAGAAGVIVLYCSIYALRQSDSSLIFNAVEKALIGLLMFILPESQLAGFINSATNELADGHLLALSFMLVTTAIYVICYFAYRPSPKPGKLQAPALYYVLVLIVAFTFVLGLMTFLLDFYRVPTLLITLMISWAMFSIFKTDHFFKIVPRSDAKQGDSVQKILTKRLAVNNDGTLVVVCASGGGIQAAGWTAMVLIQLHRILGPSFTNAIGLISSVSGGSVGTMHYLDSMNAVPDPDKMQLYKIFQNATANCLDATAWGLAYPDLWRIMGAPFLPSKLNDRGEALENSWKTVMYDSNASFVSWQASMSAGSLPIAVFNATQVEQGRRLLLSPIRFSKTTNHRQTDFNALYQNHDIGVTTAARLSATFAYISPIARDSDDIQNFHAADGGYFDNYGVFTANQWLTYEVLPFVGQGADQLDIKRIIYLEIKAFSATPQPEQSEQVADNVNLKTQSRSGWVMAWLGPLLTLANVRNATQNARNEYDVDIMANCQSKGVQFYPFIFEFPQKIAFFETKTPEMVARLTDKLTTKNYTPPLSWKLSNKQKKAIWKGWYQLVKDPDAVSYKDLHALLKIWN